MNSTRKKQDEKNLKLLRDLAGQPHNKKCFDCGQRGPTYVNTTIGSFVCTSCSGILRGLNPPHRVKSISMTSFSPQEIENLQGTGNEYCKKVWLGLWNSGTPAEPESRDEQRIKDFMVQKYERKRWYIPPQQVSASNANQSVPEPKPLKQLLGENTPSTTIQAQAPRERPRTASQTSLTSGTIPVSVAPPPGHTHHVPQPAPQPKAPAIDLLSDLGGDPFAQPPPQGQFGSPPQQGGFGSFNAFSPQPVAPVQGTFDPFGTGTAQPVQQSQQGFAAFGAPPQQQQLQQTNFFDAFSSPQPVSTGFSAFGTPASSAPSQPAPASGFGPLVSASSGTTAPSTSTSASSGDKYAALSGLDLFGPTGSSSSSAGINSASGFGAGGSSSMGMSSGPNPFSSTTSGGMSGGFQQQQQPPSNPFQGLGGSSGGFGQLNGPGRSMSPASSMAVTSSAGSGFGSFSAPQTGGSLFGGSPSVPGFGNHLSGGGFSSHPSGGGFSSFSSGQQTVLGGNQPSGWGGIGGQQQMTGGQNIGMPATSTQQNLSFGGAGMTAMAWTQFGKMGGAPQQPQMGGQMNFSGNQSNFGSSQGFGTPQQLAGFGSSQGGFGAPSMSGSGGFPGQPSGGYGNPGGLGGQSGSGFGNQGSTAFGGSMPGMGGGQFGQPMQQYGGWQQNQQANPFMNAGNQQAMQRQSMNPFM